MILCAHFLERTCTIKYNITSLTGKNGIMLLQERAEKLYAQLYHELNRFPAGGKFYGVRELISRFRVSRRVVDLTLRQLEKDGLLEHRDQCGFFIHSFRKRRHVVFYYPEWVSEELSEIAGDLKTEFDALDGDYECGSVPFDYRSNLVQQLQSSPADVLIVGPPARPLTPEEIVFAENSCKPVIFMGRNLVDASLHCTYRKYEFGMSLLVNYLKKRGHRRLALLEAEAPVGGNRIEAEAFVEYAAMNECEIVRIPCRAECGNYTPAIAHDSLFQYLERNPLNVTALFVISEFAAQGAFLALAEHGLRVPEDVSVVGSGAARCANYMNPPLTTVGVDQHESVRALVQEIHRFWGHFNEGGRISVCSVPRIIERFSVRTITELHDPKHKKESGIWKRQDSLHS